MDALIDSKRAIIGTPEDAIEMIERFRAKQGDFGVMLTQHVDWADWDQTFKSYELYARFVMPHYTGANTNRQATLQVMRDELPQHSAVRREAADIAIEKHQRRQASRP